MFFSCGDIRSGQIPSEKSFHYNNAECGHLHSFHSGEVFPSPPQKKCFFHLPEAALPSLHLKEKSLKCTKRQLPRESGQFLPRASYVCVKFTLVKSDINSYKRRDAPKVIPSCNYKRDGENSITVG